MAYSAMLAAADANGIGLVRPVRYNLRDPCVWMLGIVWELLVTYPMTSVDVPEELVGTAEHEDLLNAKKGWVIVTAIVLLDISLFILALRRQ